MRRATLPGRKTNHWATVQEGFVEPLDLMVKLSANRRIGAVIGKALMDNPNLTQEERNALSQWAAGLVGAAWGSLPDGTKVTARPSSSENRPGLVSQPTLEFQRPDGLVKIRY